MSEEWIVTNIEKFTIEELEMIDSHSRFKGYCAVGGFILGLFPQYTLMTHPFFRNYKEKGVVGRVSLLGLVTIPFLSSYIISRPANSWQEKFIGELQEKYKQKT